MGTWGVSSLQNDSAMDWIAPMLKDAEAPLDRANQRIDEWLSKGQGDSWDDNEVLAACELTAVFNGHWPESASEVIRVWTQKLQQQPSPEQLAKARKVVKLVKSNQEAETYQCWKESNSFEEWQTELQGLIDRLGKEFQPLPKVKTYADTLSLEWDDVELEIEALPPPSGRLKRIYVDLNKNFDQATLEKASRWLSQCGVDHLRIGLQPRGSSKMMEIAGDPLGAAGGRGLADHSSEELWNNVLFLLSRDLSVVWITAVFPLKNENLSTLAKVKDLQRLVLADASAAITDISALHSMRDLVSLTLSVQKIGLLDFSSLPRLVRVSLKFNEVEGDETNPIVLPVHLRHLHLNFKPKAKTLINPAKPQDKPEPRKLNPTFLKELAHLEHLDLAVEGELLSSLPLEKLPNLEFLELWHITNLDSVQSLAVNKKLKHIRLACLNSISNLSGLELLPDLQRLFVFQMSVRDFSALPQLSSLQTFILQGKGKRETVDLPALPKIEYLSLKNVQLQGIECLKGSQLKELSVQSVKVSEGMNMSFLLARPTLKVLVNRSNFGEAFDQEQSGTGVDTKTWPYPAKAFLPGDIISDGESSWSNAG